MTSKIIRTARCPRPTIEVTKQHIEEALPNESSHCMVAEAIKTSLPGVQAVSVDIQTIRWSDPELGYRYTYVTPKSVVNAIIDFDEGIKPQPFRFAPRGGQITSMARGGKGRQTPRHPELPRRATVRPPTKNETIPELVGGKPPRKTNVGGRRQFGIKGLRRGEGPIENAG